MKKVLSHFINGKLAKGKSGRTKDVFNPATGEVSAQVPLASVSEVRAAISSSVSEVL